MKNYTVLFSFLLVCSTAFAQPKPTELDKSPLDVSYLPSNYPLLKMSGKTKDAPIARVLYSRPQKNNRLIFNGLIKYNELWRFGANEATEIEFFKTVKIGGKSVSKGRYTLYCIPDSSSWTIILNKDNYCWGGFTYNSKKDELKTTISITKSNELVEAFTMYFDDITPGIKTTNLIIEWDDVKAKLPISF
jgi:hypothetical protein